MSFSSIFKKVGSVLIGIEHVIVPVAGMVFPQYSVPLGRLDAGLQRLLSSIAGVESSITQQQAGAAKESAVIADFESGLELTQSILEARGEHAVYDADQLKKVIAAQVAAFNEMALLKASFKIEKI